VNIEPESRIPKLSVRYCQELCSAESGSGGVRNFENSVGEDFPFEEEEAQGGGIEFAPVLGP
jgi:hypothetical protein